MAKGVDELINESRERRARRTGDRSPQSDYKPIQQQRGVGGTIARFLFGKSQSAQPGPRPESSSQPEQQPEPEPQAEKSSGISFSQDRILRGKEISNTGKFEHNVLSQLRGTVGASGRKAVLSRFKKIRPGGFSRTKAFRQVDEAQKSGEITKTEARSIKRKFK